MLKLVSITYIDRSRGDRNKRKRGGEKTREGGELNDNNECFGTLFFFLSYDICQNNNQRTVECHRLTGYELIM